MKRAARGQPGGAFITDKAKSSTCLVQRDACRCEVCGLDSCEQHRQALAARAWRVRCRLGREAGFACFVEYIRWAERCPEIIAAIAAERAQMEAEGFPAGPEWDAA